MDTLIKADIFFFITTIAVVALTILLVIALVYAIRILRRVDEVSEQVKEEAIEIVQDVKVLHRSIKDEGIRVKHVLDFVTRFFKKGEKKHSRSKLKSGSK